MNIQQFSQAFCTMSRPNGASFVAIDETSPFADEARDLACICHGDAMPNDIIYGMISRIADGLAEDGEDYAPEPSCYYADQKAWFSQVPSAQEYCDEALSEFGACSGVMSLISWGMVLHMNEICGIIRDRVSFDELEEA